MATKIKLQVNHGKHAKQESGQKIELPTEKKTQQKTELKPNIKKDADKQQPKKPSNKQSPKKQTNPKQSPKKQNNKQGPKQKDKSPNKKQQKKEVKVDKQLQTLKRIKDTENKTKVTIEDLIHQYQNAADDIFTNHGHNLEKQKAIQKKLEKWHQQKQQRHSKLEKLEEKSLNRSMTRQQKQKEKQQKKQEKGKQRRRKKAERKLSQLRALSQQRLKKQEEYKQYYNNEYKNKVFRFKKLEEQYKQRQKQYQQEVKQKLDKNKQKYKPMDQEQLGNFMDDYEHEKWNMIDQNQRKRLQNLEQLEKENKELMAKLWKGQCHKRVKQERQQRENQKNSGKTKLEKTKEYGTMVKDSYKPKINPDKRNKSLQISQTYNVFNEEIIETIDGKQFKKVAKQKYSNGINQGLVIENLRKPLNHDEKNKKGNEYLEFIRSLPKAPKKQLQTIQTKPEQNPEQGRKKTPSTTFKPRILKNPYYQNSSERAVSKSATIDQKRIKDPELFNYLLADMRSKLTELDLEEKAIKYGRYDGILQLQDRHNNLNRKLVQGISEKLSILSKI